MTLHSNRARMILRGGSSILAVELFLASLAHFDLLCKELYKKRVVVCFQNRRMCCLYNRRGKW